jgi:hypothetical protein
VLTGDRAADDGVERLTAKDAVGSVPRLSAWHSASIDARISSRRNSREIQKTIGLLGNGVSDVGGMWREGHSNREA